MYAARSRSLWKYHAYMWTIHVYNKKLPLIRRAPPPPRRLPAHPEKQVSTLPLSPTFPLHLLWIVLLSMVALVGTETCFRRLHTWSHYPSAAHAQSGVKQSGPSVCLCVCPSTKNIEMCPKCTIYARYMALAASKEHVDKENRTYFTFINASGR